MPPFIGLAPDAGHPPYGSPGLPGFLGVGHAAFRPSGPARNDMVLNGITEQRLQDRKSLHKSLDNLRRDIDASGMMAGLDAISQQALDILTSSKLADALDLSKEAADRARAVRHRATPRTTATGLRGTWNISCWPADWWKPGPAW